MDTYLMEYWEPSYKDLEEYYRTYFSLGNLACDIGSKFALISLVCFLTKQARIKSPDATCYQVIMKIINDEASSHDMKFIRGLSVICDDMMKNCDEFITFDMKTAKQMVDKIKEILHKWMPF